MILDNLEDFKYNEDITCRCDFCNQKFFRKKKNLNGSLKKGHKKQYCNNVCSRNAIYKNNFEFQKNRTDKKCNMCHIIKKMHEFNNNKNNICGKGNTCKECNKKYQKQWYLKNKDGHIKGSAYHSKRYADRNRYFIYRYLRFCECKFCGEKNIIKLEFDHLHNKLSTISKMIMTHSIDNIKKEIRKCQILCSNCHMVKTAKEQNWNVINFTGDTMNFSYNQFLNKNF